MSEPCAQTEGERNSGKPDVVVNDGRGTLSREEKRLSTSVESIGAIRKPLLRDEGDDEDIVTCCCFDVFRKNTETPSSQVMRRNHKECKERKRGFLYWIVTILAL